MPAAAKHFLTTPWVGDWPVTNAHATPAGCHVNKEASNNVGRAQEKLVNNDPLGT